LVDGTFEGGTGLFVVSDQEGGKHSFQVENGSRAWRARENKSCLPEQNGSNSKCLGKT
jgi:hypothetical protein